MFINNKIKKAIQNDLQTPSCDTSLGGGFRDQGQLNSTGACYQKALQLEPDSAETCFKLASAHQDQKNYKEAIFYYLKAIQLKPDFIEAYYNAGLVLQAWQRADEAITFYRRALQLKPDFAEALNNLGTAFRDRGQFDQARGCFQQAIRVKPKFAEPYLNLADLLYKEGKIDAAIEHYNRARQLKPGMIAAHNNLGNALKDRGDFDKAIACYRQVIRLNPQLPEAYYNLASALRLKEKFSDAIENFRHALWLKPNYAEAYNNLGLTYKNLGLLDPAVENFTRAVQLKPELAEARWNRSFTYLLQGNFAQGWQDYEWRLKQAHWKTIYPFRYAKPRWNGTFAPDKRLLVHDEQGLGDALQFFRYLPMVKPRCKTLIFETRKSLINLFRESPAIDELIVRSPDGRPPVDFDCYAPLLSLPGIFKTTLDNIPNNVPYLHADPGKTAHWQRRLADDGLKVGLVWAGRPMHANDRNRSCRLAQFSALAEIAGLHLYGLQKGPAADQAASWPGASFFVNLGENLEDFSDTAAVIACLDLIITVDTSVAHLAGAMAKPVWVLLPFIPDWRWMMDRQDSPWYPTMRLFRQDKHGDWLTVLERVQRQLNRLVQAHSGQWQAADPGERLRDRLNPTVSGRCQTR